MTGSQQETVERIMKAIRDYGWAEFHSGYGDERYKDLVPKRIEEVQELILDAICLCESRSIETPPQSHSSGTP